MLLGIYASSFSTRRPQTIYLLEKWSIQPVRAKSTLTPAQDALRRTFHVIAIITGISVYQIIGTLYAHLLGSQVLQLVQRLVDGREHF